ncbi:MAG: alpha/beta hydrolase family protein, partial [Candidatus Latescibacterota bacterium]
VDYRCPIEQSEQFFVALKRQGKTVEFVRFPNGAHGFRKNAHPTFREEYLQRMIDWLNAYV